MSKILIIEDDVDMSQLLKSFLSRNGFEIELTQSGSKGIAAFTNFQPDLVLCDYRLGDMDGIEVLHRIKEMDSSIPFIIMTGYSDIRVAVNVMKLGAYDYLAKPLLPDETLQLIKNALLRGNQPNNNFENTAEHSKHNNTDHSRAKKVTNINNYVYGQSAVSRELHRQVDLVAPTDYSVIIYGESGAGKEVIAQTIHKKSKRAAMPFVPMDCGAISKELAGSELFGHEKGSFTGAFATKIGHFEMANGGTIFLDEVSNLPYDVQSSLLRVVQERKVKRIGGLKEIPIDVRIIVASNENLFEAHRNGKFREDLFHRFNEFHLTVPSLRERRDDILMYAKFFLDSANQELKRNIEGFTHEVEEQFLNYPWYGNMREMKNVIRRAALLSDSNRVESKSLPFEISNFSRTAMAIQHEPEELIMEGQPISNVNLETIKKDEKLNLKSAALVAEYDLILKVLKEVNFNKSKAASILKIDRKTLYNKMKAFKLEV